MDPQKKLFILDTNVLLHDYSCIYNFKEHDVVIPIVALEELDQFKIGSDLINFHAREFTRELDKLSGDKLFTGGISLGQNKGNLSIETAKPFSETLRESFIERTADHRILAIADYLQKNRIDRNVILVSKDINLRMKAKSIGIKAEDYKTDKISDLDYLYYGITIYENFDVNIITRFYSEPAGIPIDALELKEEPIPHQYYILRNNTTSVLTHYDSFNKVMNRVEKKTSYGITPRNAEQTFAVDALSRQEIKLVALTGKAGTGKTLLALASALEQRRQFRQIFLARPIISLSNRDIGFLPGNIKEKIEPFMQPLYDNLSVIKHQFHTESNEYQKIDEMLKNEKLLITPLAYIRGRSLSNVFFIVDEAQNLTPHEIKTIITRAGEGTKMVFTGDIEQIDSPYLDAQSNGLTYLSNKMKGQEVFAHVNLIKGERSYLAELAGKLL